MLARAQMPSQVYDELKACGLDAPIREAVAEGWLGLVTPESGREATLYGEYAETLGAGEAAGLAISICRDWAFATDDRAARRAARSAGIALTGSVGILILAVREGAMTLSEGNLPLQQMRRHGYRFPLRNLDDLL